MIQNRDFILVVQVGAPGLTNLDFSLTYKKPSSTIFETYELTEDNIAEAELGFYNITIDQAVLNELGDYNFRLVGYEYDEIFEKECLPMPLSSSPGPGVCIITGNIRNLSGNSETFSNVAVSVEPRKLPIIKDSNLIMGRKLTARTDYDGFFSIPVLVGAYVIFEIKEVGLRFQVEIPDQETARIEDLIP